MTKSPAQSMHQLIDPAREYLAVPIHDAARSLELARTYREQVLKEGLRITANSMTVPAAPADARPPNTVHRESLRDPSTDTAPVMGSDTQEARYRGLFETAPDGLVVVDADGQVVHVNAQAEHQFGYSRDELLGAPVTNIIPQGLKEHVLAARVRDAADTQAPVPCTSFEFVGKRKNGSAFPIEVTLNSLASGGNILATLAIRDISVRRAAEAQRGLLETRYRNLLEAAPDAMVVVDHHDAIVLVNERAERKFGYRQDELVGEMVSTIIPEGLASQLVADALFLTAHALAQQIGTGIELHGRHRNGSEFPVEIMLSSMASADGALVTATIRDISLRKRAEDKLLQEVDELSRSNEELEQFAFVAAHDLQEPLRMVVSYTELLSRRYRGKLDADADEFISFAVDGASRMQRLIRDLLALARIGSRAHEMLDTSSEEALQQALLNLGEAIESTGATVTHDPLPMVVADQVQLIQLFQNLVANAIRHRGDDPPEVRIAATRSEQKWAFTVTDNGIGMDPQDLDRIFGVFPRLHKQDDDAGSGIGLAICKKIVERHGGEITVESAPGRGSIFGFVLTASNRPS